MKSLHFVGVGGIGMSGLAAAARDLGMIVSGSDRGAERPENRAIFQALRAQGIQIFPQDGSRFASGDMPDALVYSTAIEEDNPDFAAAGKIPRLHRSELLRLLLEKFGRKSIAVTGSCGKSSVCCYLTEALTELGADPVMLAGALSKRFRSERFAGNYKPGNGDYLVFEADESDKSLLHYGADYAIILNIGTDHYDKTELARVFGQFLRQIRCGAVLTREVYEAVKPELPASLPMRIVDPEAHPEAPYSLLGYRMSRKLEASYCGGERAGIAPDGERTLLDRIGANNMLEICGVHTESCRIERRVALAEFSDGSTLELPKSGRHTAVNALCIKAMLELLGFPPEAALTALGRFDGVWRRDDFAGYTGRGALVFDDYAHNPEKILSCLRGMRERSQGALYAVFQPHVYKPFGFMKDQLFACMDEFLQKNDRLILLEPFYAGGTSSFKPTSREVVAEWTQKTRHAGCFMVMPDRKALADYLKRIPGCGEIIVIMGARDNSLSDFALSLTEPQP